MQPNVLLVAHDPGGANVWAPCIVPLQQAGFQVTLAAPQQSPAAQRWTGLGHAVTAIPRDVCNTPDGIASWLSQQHAALTIAALLTGTSANDFTEKHLWQAAEHLDIPSLALLDQWLNYGIRFSRYGLTQANQFAANPQPNVLSNRIGVMDSLAQQEALAAGLPADRLVVVGHPALAELAQQSAPPLPPVEQGMVLSFISEPLAAQYGPDTPLGFTEAEAFTCLIDALSQLALNAITLWVRPHPKEDTSVWTERLAAAQATCGPQVRIALAPADWTPQGQIAASHVVCGMTSMMLLEAAVLGRPVVCVQPGFSGALADNPLVLCRQGWVAPATTPAEVTHRLEAGLIHADKSPVRWPVDIKAVHHVVAEIQHLAGIAVS